MAQGTSIRWLINSHEAHERRLDLSALDEDCVDHLVTYMYALDYVGGKMDDGLLHVRIHALADLYDIAALRDLAAEKFKHAISIWSLGLASRTISDDAVKTIQAVYAGPPSKMAAHVVDKLVSLCTISERVATPLLELVEEFAAFGKDPVGSIAKSLVKARRVKRPDEKRYVCPSIGDWCNAAFRARIEPGAVEITCYACQATFPKSKWEAIATSD